MSAGIEFGTVLDSKKEGRSTCYLVRATLQDYLRALPDEFANYQVQREVVSNIYLDQLVQTVLDKRHIPPLVLIAENASVQNNKLKLSGFRILDGLQRTVRLKAIQDAINFLKKANSDPKKARILARESIARSGSDRLIEIGSSRELFASLSHFLQKNGEAELRNIFDNTQWFEVWVNLPLKDQIAKMLVLNAGHKPVKTRHQLELLFLNVLPELTSSLKNKITLVREKERSAIFFSKTRKKGEFHFAEIIAALIAMSEGEPVTTNAQLITEIQNGEIKDTIVRYANESVLSEFVDTLLALEGAAISNDSTLGLQWVGREVVLVGIFAAVGQYARTANIDVTTVMPQLQKKLKNYDWLKLKEFEKERNSQDLSKINIGTVNKRAVFTAFSKVLSTKTTSQIDWKKEFNRAGNG